MPDVGPCEPWPFECGCCQIDGASPEVTGAAVMAATEILWAATGRRFGECTITGLLPCRDDCESSYGWRGTTPYVDSWPFPALIAGAWYNLGCGGSCQGGCSCNTRSQFALPGPVSRVVAIRIGGEPVPTGSYVLLNHRYVVRVDGGDWPECNDGGWSVDVAVGNEVPRLGLLAAAELACELVKACTEGQDCSLPQRVQNITRQGITQQFIDPETFFTEGRIGLYKSDLFIQAFNPNGLQSRPQILSPDRPTPRVVT